MRCATDDEKSCDNRDSNRRNPSRDISRPSRIRAQRAIKGFFLDQSDSADSEFKVGGTSPDGCYYSEDNPAFDVTCIVHSVVEGDGHRARVDEHEEEEHPDTPSLRSVVECEGELWEELWVLGVVFL